jgi:hypothetical protein
MSEALGGPIDGLLLSSILTTKRDFDITRTTYMS